MTPARLLAALDADLVGAARMTERHQRTIMKPRSRTGRTDHALWEQCKAEAVRRLGGRHSARAMQLAGRLYREAGGGYRGPKTTAQRRLSKWTRERWRTATGEKACRTGPDGQVVCDRYLPDAAWAQLTPGQVKATRAKKRTARQQYVPNTAAAKAAGRKARSHP